MSKENPVFVVGIFRSGTTLLCSLLNQNPNISLMYECDVWNFPRPLLKSRFKLDWPERLEFFNKPFSRHWTMTRDDVARLEKIRTPMDLYRAFGEQKGAGIVGEKSPSYCSRLEQLHEQYPNASFIILWRNPVEVYRSVLKAAKTSRFFAKPGMLSRMIYLQEQAIRQSARIEKMGARVYRVNYADIIDQTEQVARELCEFLGAPFDPKMLEPDEDDTKERHHNYMWKGIMERRKYNRDWVPAPVVEKLERYRSFWEREQAAWLKPNPGANGLAPGNFEYIYHNGVGKTLVKYDSLVRACFEFLPMGWLRNYRRVKSWIFHPKPARPSVQTASAWPQETKTQATKMATEIVAK
jgi:hypothetical protein